MLVDQGKIMSAGGPGASSLMGFLTEFGPLLLDDKEGMGGAYAAALAMRHASLDAHRLPVDSE
jgi:hypothetical protein